MKYFNWLWLIIALFVLGGCADSSTKGNIEEHDTAQNITINNNGDNTSATVYFPVEYASKETSAVRQDTKGTSSINPETLLNLADKAAQIASGAAQLKDAITNLDESNNPQDSYNPVTNPPAETTTTKPPVIIPTEPTTPPVVIVPVDPEEPPPVVDPEDPPPVDPPSPTPGLPSDITWLHTDVSDWKVTADLQSVSTTSSSISLPYDKAKVWPSVTKGSGTIVNANPWVMVNQDNKWYAATWEWLRPGQTTKNKSSVAGDHIKQSPLKDWTPKKGETLYFMVSGLARDSTRNVEERSQWVKFIWE